MQSLKQIKNTKQVLEYCVATLKQYDKQRLFSSLVNDKYIYITNLKPKVANFDELTLEIDQLNDEIENN